MSDHSIRIVPIALEKHPNADRLSIVRIGGFTCVVNTEMFAGKDRAAYVIPDSVIPQAMADSFCGGRRRVRAAKIRGVVSHGLLVPCDGEIGDDVTTKLGVEHYEPALQISTFGTNTNAPSHNAPTYTDISNLRRVDSGGLVTGEEVICTEKIHGANARYLFHDGKLHVGSRTNWKDETPRDVWWMAARDGEFESKLASHPGLTFYGEVFGPVQDLKYGAKPSDRPFFRCFDIFDGVKYLDYDQAIPLCASLNIPFVPILYRGPWSSSLLDMANGLTTINDAKNVREGFVVRPVNERWHHRIGRVIFKVIGDDYLLRKE
jgi:RNA ligase (TIGR02306 family)